VKLVLAAATDMLPGEFYTYDRNYLAVKLTTATSVLNQEVGVGLVFANQLAAGTYYLFLGRAGHLPVRAAAASVATGYGETTATAGVAKFPATADRDRLLDQPVVGLRGLGGRDLHRQHHQRLPDDHQRHGSRGGGPGARSVDRGHRHPGEREHLRDPCSGRHLPAGHRHLHHGRPDHAAERHGHHGGLTITPTLTLPGNVYWPTLNKLN
jgi:hypothetical protein